MLRRKWIKYLPLYLFLHELHQYEGNAISYNLFKPKVKSFKHIAHYFDRHLFLFQTTKKRSLFGIMNFHTTQKMFHFSGLQTEPKISAKTLIIPNIALIVTEIRVLFWPKRLLLQQISTSIPWQASIFIYLFARHAASIAISIPPPAAN